MLFFRHQLAVLPAVDSELLALGIAGTEEEMLGLPGAEAAAGAAAHTPSGGAPSGPSAGAAQGGTAGAAAGGAAMAGLAAAGAAAVGNSYVDNLGKAGIKEVREQTLPNTCHLTLCSAFSAHASLRATLQASAVGGRPAALCFLTTYAPPLHLLPCRCGMPCSCTATMSQCWCCCTRRSPPGRATCAKRCGRLGLQQVKASGCSKTCGRHGSPVMVQLLGHALRAPHILDAQPHRRLLPSLAAVRRRTRVC